MCIIGGYILQPRIIDDSDLIHEPPIVRELWLYLLRNVAHKSTDKFTRGRGLFRLEDISNDLHWYVGFRKMKYSKPQLTKTIRKLHERNMIETMKATRGMFITICKYEYYQDPKNYESNDEETTKDTRKNLGGRTKHKNVEELKNKELLISKYKKEFFDSLIPFVDEFGKEICRDFYNYWSEPNKSKTKIKWQMQDTWDTKLRLVRWKSKNDKQTTNAKTINSDSIRNDRQSVASTVKIMQV